MLAGLAQTDSETMDREGDSMVSCGWESDLYVQKKSVWASEKNTSLTSLAAGVRSGWLTVVIIDYGLIYRAQQWVNDHFLNGSGSGVNFPSIFSINVSERVLKTFDSVQILCW